MWRLWMYLNSLLNQFLIWGQWISLGASYHVCLFLLLNHCSFHGLRPSYIPSCCWQISGPQRCPDPRTCEHVTLQGKKDFAAVINLTILRWGDYPGWGGWAQLQPQGYLQMKVGEGEAGGFEDAILLALEKVEGSQSQGRQAVSRSWRRQGHTLLPEPPEGTQSRWHLDFKLSETPFGLWSSEL